MAFFHGFFQWLGDPDHLSSPSSWDDLPSNEPTKLQEKAAELAVEMAASIAAEAINFGWGTRRKKKQTHNLVSFKVIFYFTIDNHH